MPPPPPRKKTNHKPPTETMIRATPYVHGCIVDLASLHECSIIGMIGHLLEVYYDAQGTSALAVATQLRKRETTRRRVIKERAARGAV